jgi:hypothetical protein
MKRIHILVILGLSVIVGASYFSFQIIRLKMSGYRGFTYDLEGYKITDYQHGFVDNWYFVMIAAKDWGARMEVPRYHQLFYDGKSRLLHITYPTFSRKGDSEERERVYTIDLEGKTLKRTDHIDFARCYKLASGQSDYDDDRKCGGQILGRKWNPWQWDIDKSFSYRAVKIWDAGSNITNIGAVK